MTTGNSFPVRCMHTAVVYDDKIWVIGGRYAESVYIHYYNDVWCSSDGVSWTQVTHTAAFSPRAGHTSLIFENKMWAIGGMFSTGSNYSDYSNSYYSDVWSSTDGTTWTQVTDAPGFLPRMGHTSVNFNNMIFVIGGSGYFFYNDIWHSPDLKVTPTPYPGMTWFQATSSAAFQGRAGQKSVVFDNKMWVIGGTTNDGRKNDIWSSADGVNWILATDAAAFSERTGHACVVYKNRIWLIGGGYHNNDVWSTSDGVTWTRVTGAAAFPGRSGHTALVFNDKMWVIGGEYNSGYLNDAWYSTDGVSWIQATGAAAFSARHAHTSVVFDNRMWVIGGSKGVSQSDFLKDVWYSSDGINWFQTTSSAFPARYNFVTEVHDNKIWVMAGYGRYAKMFNDVWNSSDGVTWNLVTNSAEYPKLESPSCVHFDNKMWIIGGAGDGLKSDVWCSLLLPIEQTPTPTLTITPTPTETPTPTPNAFIGARH